jgi:hypothetical protein
MAGFDKSKWDNVRSFIRKQQFPNYPIKLENRPTLRHFSRLQWSSGYGAFHWTQSSRIQTRPMTMDFKGDKNP